MKPEAQALLAPYEGPLTLWPGAEAQSYVEPSNKEIRTRWLGGQWQQEPDRVEWRYEGLPCLIVRQANLGHLCGYVGVPAGHPLHGKGMNDADELSVHGGITYGEACQGVVCHVPAPGESDAQWWLGFDCAHLGDLSPFMADRLSDGYRDVFFVRAEVERLAKQLLQVSEGES